MGKWSLISVALVMALMLKYDGLIALIVLPIIAVLWWKFRYDIKHFDENRELWQLECHLKRQRDNAASKASNRAFREGVNRSRRMRMRIP